MKRKKILLMLACACVLFLSGCTKTDYKKAEKLLKQGKYQEAKDLYVALDDYEDSREKITKCDYLEAVALFDEGNYIDARKMFSELGDYEDSRVYYRDSAWSALHQYIEQNGTNYEEGKMLFLNVEGKAMKIANLDSDPEKICFILKRVDVARNVNFTCDLKLVLNRGNNMVDYFMSEKADMPSNNLSWVCLSDGKIDISYINKNTKLEVTNHSSQMYDNDGNEIPYEPEESLLDVGRCQELLPHLLENAAKMLEDTDLGIKLTDLGFVE